MKSLVVFSSKHGTTEKCAKEIAASIGADVLDVTKKTKDISLEYDCIILGAPLYVYSIHKPMLKFIKKHIDTLSSKKLAFFTIGQCSEEDAVVTLNSSLEKIKVNLNYELYAHLGGEINWDKLNILESIIMKMISKQTDLKDSIDTDAINAFLLKLSYFVK